MEPKDQKQEDVNEAGQELTPEQEEEAFAKGFSTAHKPEEYEVEVDETPTDSQADTQHESASEQDEPKEEPILEEFGMTASQLRQKLASIDQIQAKYEQDISKVFGKFGEINRHLQQAGPGRLNKLSLKKLREEYPDVAELLESDLSESIGGPGPGFDPSDLDQRLQTHSQTMASEIQRIQDRFEARLLAFKHPDFNTLFDGENNRWKDLEAKEWLETVADEETKRNFLTSRDANWLSDKLDKFKEWKKQKYAAKTSSNKRLERAVGPSTTNAKAPGPSDYDEFVAGFKSARQNL
jgi:hypothetical protein